MTERYVYAEHGHGHGHDHVHDHDAPVPLEDNPIWQQDNVTLHSVGIDIGSSGTQVMFAKLHLRRIGEDLTSRYIVVQRETLHRSPVALTPYESADRIDAAELGGIIDREYAAAGVAPEDVDTGVVILTGEALRRRNAERIARILAARGGELVTASAGHNMEAMLAAFGSGAARRSYDEGSRILNIDIGGGTTKLAIVQAGRVTATAAVHVGGRLLVVDSEDRIERLDPAGRAHAARAGLTWAPGSPVSPGELRRMAECMADDLVTAVTGGSFPDDAAWLRLTESLGEPGPIDGTMFSGGVAEYVYGRETRHFGDLGPYLGAAIAERLHSGALPYPLLPAGECIRATALGASEYSVQLSGNTGLITAPDELLPRRNMQVLRPSYTLGADVDAAGVAAAIRRHLAAFDADADADADAEGSDADVALALRWSGPPAYQRLAAFARGVADGLSAPIGRGQPLYLLLDGDVALTLGRILRDEVGVAGPLLVVDGLALGDFDYIDIGRVRLPSNTVPVTIKSLVFTSDPHHADDARA